MMAATLAKGATMIGNAAREPEIADSGPLPDRHGREDFRPGHRRHHGGRAWRTCTATDHRVMPDRIEAGTYAIAAAIAGGEVELVGAPAAKRSRP